MPENQQSNFSDIDVVKMWLHGKSEHSKRMYQRVFDRFSSFTGKSMKEIGLLDLQDFDLTLMDLSDCSRRTYIAALKSLISFAHKVGHIPINIGASIDPPKVKNTLSERILSEKEVKLMIEQEHKDRNRILIRFLYATGLRVSEVCQLKWCDVREVNEGAIVTIFGKGRKTRTIGISNQLFEEVKVLKKNHDEHDPVFRSQKGKGFLDPSHVNHIIKQAAKRAGLGSKVSPHWLRHAHASHSIDHGCPIHLLQKTLGHSSIATTGTYLHIQSNQSSSNYISI